jgi:hypothetical protein
MSMSMLRRDSGASRSPGKVLQHRSPRCYHHHHCCIYRMAACGIGLPIAFLSNPYLHLPTHLSLFEATGICSGAWVLALTRRLLVTSAMRCTLAPPRNALLRTTLMMTNSSTWDLDILVSSRFENVPWLCMSPMHPSRRTSLP